MPTTDLIYDVAEGIATLTLNRPDKLNAWTGEMGIAVRAAMEAAEADENVRVIILTGAGRGFCAGADMSLLNELAANGSSGARGAGAGASEAIAIRRRCASGLSGHVFLFSVDQKAGDRGD